VPIANWRWDQVTGAQTMSGTTWGNYHVVGTWNGQVFRVLQVTEAPPLQRPPRRSEPELKSPCPRPAGGWPVPDPARTSPAALRSRSADVAQPDFAGLWITCLEPMGHNFAEDPGEFVLNVTFTGDLGRHEAALRTHWGGRLCVTRRPRTLRRLYQIWDELLGAAGRRLGLWVLGAGIDEAHDAVGLDVVVIGAVGGHARRGRRVTRVLSFIMPSSGVGSGCAWSSMCIGTACFPITCLLYGPERLGG
jgi:hypothetical protein